jgi:hypothetical protein
MAESRYEKYIVREPTRPQRGANYKWSDIENARTAPPYMLMEAGKPVDGVNHMVEYMWIWKDNAMGSTPDGPPHKHDCEEMFLFIGTNKDNTHDLGCDIEFWLGEGKEADKLNFSASAMIYVPRNLTHMPIVFKNVKKPLLMIVFAAEAGDLGKKTIKCLLNNI